MNPPIRAKKNVKSTLSSAIGVCFYRRLGYFSLGFPMNYPKYRRLGCKNIKLTVVWGMFYRRLRCLFEDHYRRLRYNLPSFEVFLKLQAIDYKAVKKEQLLTLLLKLNNNSNCDDAFYSSIYSAASGGVNTD